MQKTVLEEIIQAEKEAGQTISAARKKAAEIISTADIEYNQSISQAKENARVKIQAAVAAVREKTAADFQKAVKESEEENRHFILNSFEKIDSAAENIAAKIIRPEYER